MDLINIVAVVIGLAMASWLVTAVRDSYKSLTSQLLSMGVSKETSDIVVTTIIIVVLGGTAYFVWWW